jgi:hypothetical protein
MVIRSIYEVFKDIPPSYTTFIIYFGNIPDDAKFVIILYPPGFVPLDTPDVSSSTPSYLPIRRCLCSLCRHLLLRSDDFFLHGARMPVEGLGFVACKIVMSCTYILFLLFGEGPCWKAFRRSR